MSDLNLAGYSTRRTWSDKHLDTVRIALARKFFAESSLSDDTKFGIDLYIPKLEISIRIRQLKYKNFQDFTLRNSAVGVKSEYEKLLTGARLDFLFYAYALDKDTLAAGYLIDIQAWRLVVQSGEVKGKVKNNLDGSSFIAFPFHPTYTEQII
jgi:hypothetical protein